MAIVSQSIGLTYLNINAIYIFHTKKWDREELVCGHPEWSETVDRPGNVGGQAACHITHQGSWPAGRMDVVHTHCCPGCFLPVGLHSGGKHQGL